MRRVAWLAAALAAACGTTATPDAGPLDRIYLPTGLAVHDGRLLVASSNADLRYDSETGGSVMALEIPSDPVLPAHLAGAVNVASFAGDLAVADPVLCPGIGLDPLAVFATRGSNELHVLRIDPLGEMSCDRCNVPLTGPFGDPLAVAVACRGQSARAFIGHLRSPSGQAWITEYDLGDLDGPTVRNMAVGTGPVRAFAYDADRDRLYVIGLATGRPTPLRWIDLGGCDIAASAAAGGCTVGEATFPSREGTGIELRSMALANDSSDPSRRRAFLTGRYYDLASAGTAGGRTTDLGGVLLVVDLVENAFGGVDVEIVNEVDFGRGAQDVRVLPARSGKRDVVAALAVNAGELLIYDDETDDRRFIRREFEGKETGASDLGHQPYGLAVDPVAVSSVARVYVGSFQDNYVSLVDVPLDTPDAAFIVTTAPNTPRRIRGGTR